MALSHAGFAIPGLHESPQFGDWDRQEQFLSVFGLVGAVHMPGGVTTLPITWPVVIYANYATTAQLFAYLHTLQSRIGQQGTLAQTGTVVRTLPHVLFEGFTPQGGCLFSAQLGWFQQGVLNFRQLRP